MKSKSVFWVKIFHSIISAAVAIVPVEDMPVDEPIQLEMDDNIGQIDELAIGLG